MPPVTRLLTIEAALATIRASIASLQPRREELALAVGATLAEDVAAEFDSPPYDKAMMDGYAVRVADGAGARRVVEEVVAGATPGRPVGLGEATRIMTGAPLPAGADAVVPFEQTDPINDTHVQIHDAPLMGRNIQQRGSLHRAGDRLLDSGTRLRSIELAILAEAGVATPLCLHLRPKVAVLATGDELVPAHQRPGRSEIRNTNGPLLVAAVEEAGAVPIDLGIARDDRAHLESHLLEGLSGDVLVVSGGVSAGDRDLAPSVLTQMGTQQRFHGVDLRPGKPTWFGVHPGGEGGKPTLVFGLPGNPVSSLVCFRLFVVPALAALRGRPCELGTRPMPMARPHSQGPGRETFRPARISEGAVELIPWQGSADLVALAAATHLARLPACGEWSAGDPVEVLDLTPGPLC